VNDHVKITRRKKFMVGLFMASGILLGLLVSFWLGLTTFFEEGKYYATYFDQSVQGLVVDSPVKFRGVTIGRVTRINVAPDTRHVEVIVIIEQDMEITPGMFAKLNLVGITGIMFVEIDVLPEGERQEAPDLTFKPPYPVIPSRPSDISMILTDIERVITKLTELDLEALSAQARETMRSFDRTATAVREAVDQLEIDKSVASFQGVIEQMRQELQEAGKLMEKTGRLIELNEPELQQAIRDFREAMARLDEFAGQAAKVAEGTDEYVAGMYRQLLNLSRSIEQTIRKFDDALEEFIDDPGQMFLREPPPPRDPGM
jgi:phospholipid/cholesterol/gamma-HCH transport system substrate-binding protein